MGPPEDLLSLLTGWYVAAVDLDAGIDGPPAQATDLLAELFHRLTAEPDLPTDWQGQLGWLAGPLTVRLAEELRSGARVASSPAGQDPSTESGKPEGPGLGDERRRLLAAVVERAQGKAETARHPQAVRDVLRSHARATASSRRSDRRMPPG